MPLFFWLPIILLGGMFAVAADDAQKLTSVQLRALQDLLADELSQRIPPVTTSLTRSLIVANAATDKRVQSESVPATDRAWQPVSPPPSGDTQSTIGDRRSAAAL